MLEDEVSIVGNLEAILKTSRSIEKLTTTSIDDLPTVKKAKLNVALKHMKMAVSPGSQSHGPEE